MKKLKRDLTKPEKVEVKKKVVKHQDEYPDGPEFEWQMNGLKVKLNTR